MAMSVRNLQLESYYRYCSVMPLDWGDVQTWVTAVIASGGVLYRAFWWSFIEGMLPWPTGRKGRPFSDARAMVEAIVYRYRCGIAWRDLPEVFGPWQTVWTWHRRMAGDGTWDKVLAKLTAAADAAGLVDWSLSVDSTIARAHQHATNTTRLTEGWIELPESVGRAA